VDLYQRLALEVPPGSLPSVSKVRTEETRAIETRDNDLQVSLLAVEAP
jgi:hypothetical protein